MTSQQREQLKMTLRALEGRRFQLEKVRQEYEESAAKQPDFELNGIYYKKLSESEVAVSCKGEGHQNRNAYVGDLVLPASINREGVEIVLPEKGYLGTQDGHEWVHLLQRNLVNILSGRRSAISITNRIKKTVIQPMLENTKIFQV